MSNILLNKIKEYAFKNKTLFFLEALIPTITIFNKLIYIPIFKNISYRKNININDIKELEFYHPIKKINEHIIIRNKIKNNKNNEIL